MTVVFTIAIVAAVVSLVTESALRFYRWRFAPLRLRVLYGLFLLSPEVTQAVSEIHQRVERLAASSFTELFALYAKASGRSIDEIEELFVFRMSWGRMRRMSLVLRNHLRWHIGLVPKPGQHLRTVSITDDGFRASGTAPEQSSSGVKRVLLTGGSVAYGYGATSDETTVAGKMQEYLNALDPRGECSWVVVNHAFPAATSFQELIGALQCVDAAAVPAYIVSLSGCNDVDQQFGGAEANVSALAQGYTRGLEQRGRMAAVIRAGLRPVVLVEALSRFVTAYRQWPGPQTLGAGPSSSLPPSRRPDDIDQPDIYPLW